MKNFIIALIAIATLNQCSTDIDLTAPYEDITVVYGLLDQTREVQFIKINKAFLGDIALEDMAAVRDSVQYDDDQIASKRVEEWVGDQMTDSWELQDSLVQSINSSIFYVEGITDTLRKVYYFTPNNLDEDAEYRLIVEFDNKETVTGVTNLIPNSSSAINKPVSNVPGQLNTNQNINFATSNTTIDGVYPDYQFRWDTEEGARRYELLLEFTYIENVWTNANHTDLVSSTEKTFEWDLGSVKTSSANGNEDLEQRINGELFFLALASELDENPVITREIGVLDENVNLNHFSAFEFILTVGDEDLNSYLEFNEPVTGLVQERPQWTNVNNGQGLFSSRLIQKSINVKMHPHSIRELCIGQHTGNLNFCTKDATQSTEAYYCGE